MTWGGMKVNQKWAKEGNLAGSSLGELTAGGLGATHFKLTRGLSNRQGIDEANEQAVNDTAAGNAILVADVAANLDEAAGAAKEQPQAI